MKVKGKDKDKGINTFVRGPKPKDDAKYINAFVRGPKPPTPKK